MSASTAVVVVGPLGIRVVARGERRNLAEFISTQGDLEQAAPSVARLLLELDEQEALVVLECGTADWMSAFRAAMNREGVVTRRAVTVADVAAHAASDSVFLYASDKGISTSGPGSSPAQVVSHVDWKQFRLDVVDAIVKLFRETAGFDLHHAGVSPNEALAWFASSVGSGAKAPSLEASLRVGSWPVSVPVERLQERSRECAKSIRGSIKRAIGSNLQDGVPLLISEPLEAFVGARDALGLPRDRAQTLSDLDLAQAARRFDEANPAEELPGRSGRTPRVERQRVRTGGTQAGGRTVRVLGAAVVVLLVLQIAQAAWLVGMSRSRPASVEDVERLVAERLTQASAELEVRLEEDRARFGERFDAMRAEHAAALAGERQRVDEAIAKSDRELEDWKKRASTVSYDPTVPVDVVRARRFELVDVNGAPTAALRPSSASGELWLSGTGSGASIDAAKASKIGAPATIPDDLVVKSLTVTDTTGTKTMATLSGRTTNGGILWIYDSETGNRIAQIGPYSNRRAGIIQLWDQNQKNVAVIGSAEQGGYLRLNETVGENPLVVAGPLADGEGGILELYNSDNKRVINIGSGTSGGYMIVANKLAETRVGLLASATGSGTISVLGSSNKINGELTADSDGGLLRLSTRSGDLRVMSGVGKEGYGFVEGLNAQGNRIWSLSITESQRGGLWVYDQWGQNDRSIVSGP